VAISAPSAAGRLMLELSVLPGLLLVLNVKVKVIGVNYVLIPFLEAVNISSKTEMIDCEEVDGLFLRDDSL